MRDRGKAKRDNFDSNSQSNRGQSEPNAHTLFSLPLFSRKFHTNLSKYTNVAITVDEKQFLKHTGDSNFLDFHLLSDKCCIIIKDGLVIKSHNNIPSISAKVYRLYMHIYIHSTIYIYIYI